jgi:hypothetical protein
LMNQTIAFIVRSVTLAIELMVISVIENPQTAHGRFVFWYVKYQPADLILFCNMVDKSKNTRGLFILFFVLIMTCLTLVSSGINNGNIVISIDAYATTFNGASVGGGINGGGGDNGLGNSGFCGTNPSDPSCFNSQTSDCSINPSDPSCQQPSCPTIAIAMPCTPPNPTSASPRNSTSSSTTSSAGGGS